MGTFKTITVSFNNNEISADPTNQLVPPGTWDVFWVQNPPGASWKFTNLVFQDSSAPFTEINVQDQTIMASDDNGGPDARGEWAYTLSVESLSPADRSEDAADAAGDTVITNVSEGRKG